MCDMFVQKLNESARWNFPFERTTSSGNDFMAKILEDVKECFKGCGAEKRRKRKCVVLGHFVSHIEALKASMAWLMSSLYVLDVLTLSHSLEIEIFRNSNAPFLSESEFSSAFQHDFPLFSSTRSINSSHSHAKNEKGIFLFNFS